MKDKDQLIRKLIERISNLLHKAILYKMNVKRIIMLFSTYLMVQRPTFNYKYVLHPFSFAYIYAALYSPIASLKGKGGMEEGKGENTLA